MLPREFLRDAVHGYFYALALYVVKNRTKVGNVTGLDGKQHTSKITVGHDKSPSSG